MTPRSAIQFVRSPLGAFLSFLLLVVIAFVVASGFQKSGEDAPAKEPSRSDLDLTGKGQKVQTVNRSISPLAPSSSEPPAPPPASSDSGKQKKATQLPPLSLYVEPPNAPAPEQMPLGDEYAPFGRLVQCELVVTVDSSSISTPIIGLVTDDVYHNGRLIIPAGTEVHGAAKVDRVRERIADGGSWTLVWQSGEELKVTGIALDREREPDETGWSITDGSAGLRGQLLKSDDLAEVKLFAATFLSGAASSLTEREQTLFGSRATSSLRNAPFTGAQDVLNVYAKQILDTIQRDGFYVRVPAGKQFYLYVTQTLDKSHAIVGGTRLSKVSPKDSPSDPRDPIARLRRNIERVYPTRPEAREPQTISQP